MAGSRRTRLGLGAVATLLLSMAAPLHAQIVRSFTPRFSTNASGTVQIVANALLTCPASATCTSAQAGTGGTLDNNNFSMVDIDIDADATTQNSSSATFTLPPGGTVLFAGLYWGARSNAAARNAIRFRTPALAGYTTVTATQLDANGAAYQGFADVTALVQAGGSGAYLGANVQRTLGTDQYAGWSLVVVVGDPVELRRNLVVFDGFGTVQSSASTINIPVNGFLTPSSGAVNAQLGVVAYEGDLGQTGDVLRLNGTGLSDAVNPANNVFNSSISRLGTRLTAKNPNYLNQIGFDADVINASGILPNGSTSTTITLTTGGETYYPGVVTLATQLYVPDLTTTFTKTVIDVNGGLVQRGDTLDYLVSFTNTGQDTALAVVVTDTIPAGSTFVPGSIIYVTSVPGGPPTGPKTDLPGDDAANFEVGSNRMVARLGIGASSAAGGRLGPGQGSSFRFRVVVNAGVAAGTTISNQAGIDYTGQTLGDLFNGRSDGDAGTPGIQPTVVTVAAGADIQVGKAGPAAGSVTVPLTYTLTLTNLGPDAALGVVARDTLPASFTFVSATGGGTAVGNVVSWPAIASLANGASQNFTVTATPTAAGTFINIAAATSATFDGAPANNNGSAAGSRVTTLIANSADVGITKSGAATVNAGAPLVYTIAATNAGPSAAAAVVVTDTLPAGATFVSATGGGTLAGNVVTWPAIASLANGASQGFTLTVTAPATGTLLNIAASTAATPDATPGNNNGSAPGSRVTTSVIAQANIAVTKSGPATVAAGATFSYVVTVANAGPGAAAGVVVSDTLPATATFVSATSGGVLGAGNVLTWPAIVGLANGANQSFTVTVTAPGSGPLLNIAAGTSSTPDPVPADNDGSAAGARVTTAVTAMADVQVTKTGPATVDAGQTFTYTVTVVNAGPSAAATVVVRDSVPAAGTFVSATGSGTRVGRRITWPTITSLAQGASQVFTVSWTAPANPAVPLSLRNVAYGTSTTPDPAPGNNNNTNPAAIVNTTVVASADIATTKTGPATVNSNTNFSYTITTRNNGPSQATSVAITDTLPATATFVSATGGGVLSAGNVVTWPVIAAINSGAQVTRTVTVRAPGGTLLNIAASSSATADPNAGDNNGSAAAARVTTVVNSADVATTKTGPATVNGGANYTYTLTARNHGPGTATGIVVTDTLPATVTFVSATNGGVLGAGNVVTWPTIVTLANAATATRSVTVKAAPSGMLVNIAASTATSDDAVPGNNDGSAAGARVTTVVNGSDVVTTKTGPAAANGGANITYTLTVRNTGPGVATGIVLTDTLPSTATFVSASAGGTLGAGNVVTWPTVATLANGAATTRTVVVTTPATGPLLNIAASTSTSLDPTSSNNDGSAATARVTTAINSADVATTKTGPATASGGANYTYTITVRNQGPNPASTIVVVDTLPATVTFVSATNGGVLGAGNVVTWPAIGTLANGASTIRRVTVTAPASGSLLNIAASTSATGDPDDSNNNGSQAGARVTTVVTAADLVTTKAGPATVNPGGSITYTITTRNLGPNAAPTVVVRDTLPASATFVSASNAGVLGAGNVVTWPAIGNLANGATAVRTVTVTAPATGTLLNIAASSSATTDPDPANNDGSLPAARVTTTVNLTDVVTTKTGPATATIGSNISYAITVRNVGPVSAVGVVVTDTLPAGFTFVSATGGASASGNVVTWPAITTLASGASQNVTVTVAVPLAGSFTNIASSTAASGDLNPANNDGSLPAARVITVVLDQADVATTKSGPSTVNAGQAVTYTITMSNNGPTSATDVIASDTLPATATFVSASGGGMLSGNVVTWPAIASLANGSSQAYTVTVTAPATGSLLDIAASTSSTSDPVPANNDGSLPAARVTTTVVEQADVVTTKIGPATVTAGQNFSYALTVTNAGPSASAAVVVTDTLPTGVTFVSATAGGTLSGNIVTWPAIASLANGASQAYTVTVTAPASGFFTNVVASTATTADPVPANNDGSDPGSRVTTTVSELADVVTSKAGPARVNANAMVDYTISVTNLGPSAAASVLVSDPVPAGAIFVSASNGGTLNGATVQWPAIGSLAVGQTVTYMLQVRAPLSGTLSNVVSSTATTPDPVPGNNDGSAPAAVVLTTIEPVDLAVSKTSLPEFRIGTVGSYTLTVRNVGNAPSVGTITVVDTLPASLRYASADGPGWSCGNSGPVVTCTTAAPLAAGAASAIQLNVDVLPSAAPSVTNNVAVATPGDTASGGNNASGIATIVRAVSPLVARKAAGATTAEIGDVIDYTLMVENQSAQPVPAVVFNDQLPIGFAYQPGTARVNGVAVPDPAGAPGPALAFPVGTVAGNATVTVTYRVYLGPGATAGDGLNRALAVSGTSGVASNLATAKVEVTGGVFSDRGIIAGKIFVDCACDPNGVQGPRDIGIPGVRIMLEDGTSTVTDVEGKFNFYGLAPRVHVLKVDVTTMPPGSKLAAISSRNAGDGWTRFVDLRNGEFTRGDFAEVSHDPGVLAAVIARRNRGAVMAAIPDSTPMVLSGDSLAPSGQTVPGGVFQPLIGGLSTPVTAEGAASPVLRLPQSEQPERLARPTDSRLELLVPAQGIPADGQTAVPVQVKIVAADGSLITTPTTLTLENTLGRWLVEDLDATQPGVQAQLHGGEGQFMLAASPREGVGEIRATSGALVQTGRVAFLPVDRPLTAVGILEGRVDLRSLTKGALVPTTPQDGFEQELKDISISGDSGLNQAGARAALYLQGKVKGSYLLTLAFDTEQDPGKRYMQDIQPDEFYPVYGDASVKDYGAQSYDRLYVRIDKDRNYFLYGDYQTPSPSQARQLGSYLRSLTGAVQHFENNTVQANAFAARTRITQVVDELRGMGISGPYQLSQGNARINSERIEILTRDRNQPERVLKIVPLTRFTDYTVEPFTGRILLRQPLPSLDAEFNQVSMRISYEVEPQDAPQSWTYGADAQVRVSSFAEVGGAVIQDDNPYNARQIYTANGSAKLGPNTQLVVEGAITNTDSLGEGPAGRFELKHQAGRFGANVFGAMSSTDFSNPSATFGAGQLQFGARASMQVDQKNGVRAEALLSEDRVNGGRRKGALLAYERAISRLFRAEVGYRWAEETTAPVDTATAITPGATPNETNAVGVKLTGILPNRRGSASVDFEQDVVNTDQRRAALAAEYWVFPRLRLYGRYELLSSFAGPYALNGAQRLAQAVVGFDLAYFKDGQFFSEYRARDAFSGREAEATIGLRNRWQVAPGVRLDASFERVNPIKGADGAGATAVTAAVEYTRSPLWKGTLRAEYRNATSGDNFLATLGYARKLTRDWTFLGRGFWNALPDDQLRTRGQLGLAWRQTDENKWNGLARVEHGVERLRNGPSGELTSRQLDIAVAQLNYQPILRLTLSAQYAAKWLRQDDAFLSQTATQLGQLRGVYDLDRNWDVGLQGSTMWGGSFRSMRYGVGGELGRRVINNLRLAAGYNLFGFKDNDLRETDYTLQGAYFRLDFKFDESILPGLKRTEETAP